MSRSFKKWSPAEWDQVVANGARLYVEGKATSQTEALRMADSVLPADRRRDEAKLREAYPSNYSEWVKRWDLALESARQAHAERVHEIAVQNTQTLVAVAQHAAKPVAHDFGADSDMTGVAPVREPAFDDLASEPLVDDAYLPPRSPVETLAVALGEVIGALVLDALQHPLLERTLQEKMQPIMPNYRPRMPRSERVRKPRILIIGLLGSQREIIDKEFGDRFDIRHKFQDDSLGQIEEHAKTCEATFAMVGKSGHDIESIKKYSPHYQRVNGMIGELRRVLNMYFLVKHSQGVTP